jgi:putative ABC transport system permease protein
MRALRTLVMHRGFAVSAILTLALGIAATTAIFSVVHGVLLRPLPYPEPDRLVRLSEFHPGANAPFRGTWLSNHTYFAWRDTARTIGPIATFDAGSYTVGDTDPQRMAGASASVELFEVLRVRPAYGRFFTPDDVAEGAPPVVVLSAGLWHERFGGRTSALGDTLLLDRKPHVIVGITEPGFAFPNNEVRFWTPQAVDPPGVPAQPRMSITSAIARLAPGVTAEQAAAEGTAAARREERPFVAELMFGKGGPVEVRVEGVVEQLTRSIRPALLVLSGAVGVLLLIACANVANLLLSRGVARERELAVRIAVGASRWDIVRQLLAESLLIAAAAGVAGIAGAWALLRALPLIAPQDLPRMSDIRLDGMVLLFALAVVVVSALLSGLVPALRAARTDLLPSLRESAGASSSLRTVRLRHAMLAGEAALAVMLLIGSGLLIRSFVLLINVDPGYDASNVLTADVYLPGAEVGKAETTAFLEEFLPRVRALPGVTAAGVSNMMPLGRSTSIVGFTVPLPGRAPVTARSIVYVSSPGYAEALRLRLRSGRLLDARDVGAPVQSLVVNEEFVRTFLDNVNPIGVQFPSILAKGSTSEIVGVVGNVLKDGLDARPQPEIYVPLAHGYNLRNQVSFVMRAEQDPASLVAPLRQLLRDLRPDAALDRVQPLDTRIDASVAQPRFAAWVLALFAALAMILSAIGLYSVLAYSVSRRQRELGVRTALGASRARIVSQVCREGLVVAAAGLAIGVVGAAALSRWLESMLFGIKAHDVVAFTVAPLVLLVVALIACLIPARRAASTDPTLALRAE